MNLNTAVNVITALWTAFGLIFLVKSIRGDHKFNWKLAIVIGPVLLFLLLMLGMFISFYEMIDEWVSKEKKN